MTRDEALARLRQHEGELKRLGIESLFIFGSTARGEATETSDIDLFFDHPIGSLGLYELIDLKAAASRILDGRADIMSRRSIHPRLRASIEAAVVRVF